MLYSYPTLSVSHLRALRDILAQRVFGILPVEETKGDKSFTVYADGSYKAEMPINYKIALAKRPVLLLEKDVQARANHYLDALKDIKDKTVIKNLGGISLLPDGVVIDRIEKAFPQDSKGEGWYWTVACVLKLRPSSEEDAIIVQGAGVQIDIASTGNIMRLHSTVLPIMQPKKAKRFNLLDALKIRTHLDLPPITTNDNTLQSRSVTPATETTTTNLSEFYASPDFYGYNPDKACYAAYKQTTDGKVAAGEDGVIADTLIELSPDDGEPKSNWVRILQVDGTFRFKWYEQAMTQKEVDEKYNGADVILWDVSRVVCSVDYEYLYKLYNNGTITVEYEKEAYIGAFKRIESKKSEISNQMLIGAPHFPVVLPYYWDRNKKKSFPYTFNGEVKDDKKKPLGNFDVKVDYYLPNLTIMERDNLHIIQTVYSNTIPDNEELGRIDLFENGSAVLAFVDGGRKSKAGRELPWYLERTKTEKIWTEDKNQEVYQVRIHLSDQPGTIVDKYTILNFESYIVIANYNNLQRIKILSMVAWGFRREEGVNSVNTIKKTINTPTMIKMNQLTPFSQKIWNNDYGQSNFKFL